ncbi:hypothetical protein PROCH_0509 [Prochlorococcus marinus str. EQPAC1]|nr:hypothetical protein PROCH_0509 [Prochlorococcus marinus str. EQPAC1]
MICISHKSKNYLARNILFNIKSFKSYLRLLFRPASSLM